MILDTNALSALSEGDVSLETLLSGSDRHHLPVIVLGEYRFGLLRSRHRAQTEKWVQQLEREFIVLDVDSETARYYAQVREQLRRDGRPVPHSDLWISALALQHSLPVASLDMHFDYVSGLKRLAW